MEGKVIVMNNRSIRVERNDLMQINDVQFIEDNELNKRRNPLSQIGIWVDGQFSWIHSSDWTSRTYMLGDCRFIYSEAHNDELALTIKIDEAIHPNKPLYYRRFYVFNNTKVKRKIKLFFYQNVSGDQKQRSETAFFAPKEKVMFHYAKDKCWLFNGSFGEDGIVQYTTFSHISSKPLERHCLNLQEGKLFFNPIAKGSVTSILSLEAELLPYETKPAYYWVGASKHKEEIMNVNQNILDIGPHQYMNEFELEEQNYKNNMNRELLYKKIKGLSVSK